MDIPFLSSEDVLFLEPLQLETQFFFYNHRLLGIRGELVDNLEYVGSHPLMEKIQAGSLGDLYTILETEGSLDLLDDVTPEHLSVLCHNHRLLANCLQHYNDTHLLLDNVLTRRQLLGKYNKN